MTAAKSRGEDLGLNLPRINTDEHGSESDLGRFDVIAFVETDFLFSDPCQSV